MHAGAIWTEPSVRATAKLNAEPQVLLVRKKWMQQRHVLAERQKGNLADDHRMDKDTCPLIQRLQRQLKAMSK